MHAFQSNLNTLYDAPTNRLIGGGPGSGKGWRVTHHDAFFDYVMPKIQAHGLQDRVHEKLKKYLK
jgi:hypothetical protein